MALTPKRLAEMRLRAQAAKDHPTWSVAYSEDVPALLDALASAREGLAHYVEVWNQSRDELTAERARREVAEADADRLAEALDASLYSRPGITWRTDALAAHAEAVAAREAQ